MGGRTGLEVDDEDSREGYYCTLEWGPRRRTKSLGIYQRRLVNVVV